MRYRTTLLLMLISLVAGAFIWIMERKALPPDMTRGPAKSVLNIEPERINYASFYRDGTFIECVNEYGQWFINKPVRDRADNAMIHRILAIVTMLPKEEIITLPERAARNLTLDDYGLTKPRAWIVLGVGASRRKLSIGGDSPLRDAVYVRLDNGDEIIATSTNMLDSIPERVDAIRDRRLLRGSPSYATRLEIKRRDKPMLQLVLEGSEWVIHKPVIARADWVKVSSVLDSLFAVTIRQFVSDTMADPIAYGVGDDEAILKVGLWQRPEQDGETVLFGKPADVLKEMVYVNRKGSASVYAVDKRHVETLDVAAGDLRDSRLYFMASDKIRFVSVKEGDNVLQLRRLNEGDWEMTRPQQWAADGRVVTDFVNRLNALRIMAFMDGPVTNLQVLGLDEPARVIRVADYVPESGAATQDFEQITLSAARRERTLKLSGPRPGQEAIFARFDDDPQVYRMSAASVMTLSVDPLKYRDRIVLTLQSDMIRAITLRKNGVEESVERDSAGAWKPAMPGNREADVAVVEHVLAEVASLGVSRFECSGKRNLAVYGLHADPVSLTFSLTGEGGISKSLLFGSASEDLGVYAMLQGQDVVFVLEEEKVDLLVRNLTR